jgi:hypothetical protein
MRFRLGSRGGSCLGLWHAVGGLLRFLPDFLAGLFCRTTEAECRVAGDASSIIPRTGFWLDL